MKLLLTGGGTGGHIHPAIAIADAFRASHPDAEICFVGTQNGMEATLVPAAHYPFFSIRIMGLQRRFTLKNLKALYYFLSSKKAARKILTFFAPDCVIGTGGYVCYPMLRAAQKKGIPTVLHESNATPGLAVKMLAPQISLLFTNFEATASYLPDSVQNRIRTVGNPLRKEFSHMNQQKAKKQLGIPNYHRIILSCGGSLGAAPINTAVLGMLQQLCGKHPDWLFLHATGKRDYPAVQTKLEQSGLQMYSNFVLSPFFTDMPVRMAAADLIISRAGAMSLSEIAQAAKPSILIPSPYVANQHQFKNAAVFADAGAAILLEEAYLTATSLSQTVEQILNSPSSITAMQQSAAQFAHPEATRAIVTGIEELLSKS